MISRRSIRIKVLQALYSQAIIDAYDSKNAKEIYNQSIQEVLEVNLIYLLYFREVITYFKEYASIQSNKFLLEDKFVDVSILDGLVYSFLSQNEELTARIKKNKSEQYVQTEFVRSMFKDLVKLKEYSIYIKSKSIEDESILFQAFCKRILFKNEDLINYLESYFANTEEDSDLVHFTLRRSLRNLSEKRSLQLSLGYDEMKNLAGFATSLIEKTLESDKEFMSIIEPKLKGWDADRIPILDMMIIKMAMAEMLYFESIPLKVTVNEYIDLSKLFCSVKSKDFVNGIMDRIMKELQAEGRIHKKGRGLD
jgi:N utilization substance protein B